MYNKVTENDIEFLRTATSPDRVLVGDEISEDYSHDELAGVKAMPEVLVRVLYTEEVSKTTGATITPVVKNWYNPN